MPSSTLQKIANIGEYMNGITNNGAPSEESQNEPGAQIAIAVLSDVRSKALRKARRLKNRHSAEEVKALRDHLNALYYPTKFSDNIYDTFLNEIFARYNDVLTNKGKEFFIDLDSSETLDTIDFQSNYNQMKLDMKDLKDKAQDISDILKEIDAIDEKADKLLKKKPQQFLIPSEINHRASLLNQARKIGQNICTTYGITTLANSFSKTTATTKTDLEDFSTKLRKTMLFIPDDIGLLFELSLALAAKGTKYMIDDTVDDLLDDLKQNILTGTTLAQYFKSSITASQNNMIDIDTIIDINKDSSSIMVTKNKKGEIHFRDKDNGIEFAIDTDFSLKDKEKTQNVLKQMRPRSMKMDVHYTVQDMANMGIKAKKDFRISAKNWQELNSSLGETSLYRALIRTYGNDISVNNYLYAVQHPRISPTDGHSYPMFDTVLQECDKYAKSAILLDVAAGIGQKNGWADTLVIADRQHSEIKVINLGELIYDIIDSDFTNNSAIGFAGVKDNSTTLYHRNLVNTRAQVLRNAVFKTGELKTDKARNRDYVNLVKAMLNAIKVGLSIKAGIANYSQ